MNTIPITIVYALPEIQYIYEIKMKKGATVKDAILFSNILNDIKNIKFYNNKVGIYNKLVHLNQKIQSGDRIEIYRRLKVDPKERRREKHLFIKNK